MKHEYELKICGVCEGMITHLNRNGGLMTPLMHSLRVCCNNSACLSEIHRIHATRDFGEIDPKPCLNCPEDISLSWDCGRKKTKKDYDKQQFHSNACRGKWRVDHPECEPKFRIRRNRTRFKRPCWAQHPPARDNPIDRFIYGTAQ